MPFADPRAEADRPGAGGSEFGAPTMVPNRWPRRFPHTMAACRPVPICKLFNYPDQLTLRAGARSGYCKRLQVAFSGAALAVVNSVAIPLFGKMWVMIPGEAAQSKYGREDQVITCQN